MRRRRAGLEESVLRLFAPPTRFERFVDLVLGVSRRRRQAAYFAIGGGLAALRPVLKRAVLLGLVLVVLIVT
jgi:hypothetical protein